MAAPLICVLACALATASFAEPAKRRHYSPVQYLKNYALSACLADGYAVKEVRDDAVAAANGYKELGSLDIDAYNAVAGLIPKFLSKDYMSQSREQLVAMKCIDFFHSKELDRLARRYAGGK